MSQRSWHANIGFSLIGGMTGSSLPLNWAADADLPSSNQATLRSSASLTLLARLLLHHAGELVAGLRAAEPSTNTGSWPPRRINSPHQAGPSRSACYAGSPVRIR